jgi:hypothetical protein
MKTKYGMSENRRVRIAENYVVMFAALLTLGVLFGIAAIATVVTGQVILWLPVAGVFWYFAAKMLTQLEYWLRPGDGIRIGNPLKHEPLVTVVPDGRK